MWCWLYRTTGLVSVTPAAAAAWPTSDIAPTHSADSCGLASPKAEVPGWSGACHCLRQAEHRNPGGSVMPDFEQSRDMDAAPDTVWRLVCDPHRVAEWVPTTVSSQPAGDEGVRLRGESHGHDYDTRGGFVTDTAARRLSWDSARREGYRGVLTVTGHGAG